MRRWIIKHNKWIFNLTIGILMSGFIIIIVSSNLMQIVENRALTEVDSTIQMQTSTIKNDMNEQFNSLGIIADMLENGGHFASKGMQPTIKSIKRTFQLCTICMADMDGNTIDYQGNAVGNYADKEYFQEIVDGSHTQICANATETKKSDGTCIVLSIPVYDKDRKIQGVLFCKKNDNILENSIFSKKKLNNSTVSIYLCDESGQVITANENGYNFFAEHNISQDREMNINDLGDNMQKIRKEGTTQRIEIKGKSNFAGYTAVDECGWGLYCLVDEENASKTYNENLRRIKNTIISISIIFMACMVYIFILVQLYRWKEKQKMRIVQQYNENYRHILDETHCAVVEFDPDIKTVVTIQENFGSVKLESLDGSLKEYEEFKLKHAEFDFEELEREINIVKRERRTCAFETMLARDENTFYWLKAKLIPILDETRKVERIYCMLFDVSDLHSFHETALDTYAKIPGAVHRYCLNDPLHMNYYSEGFCKMLGYTHTEIDEIIGADYQYSNLILPEDRGKFTAFIEELAQKGGTKTCEYRMMCKDGNSIEVSETMDVKTSSSGTVYGYAVVTDIYKYRAEQKQLQQELAMTQEKLIQSRVQNAGSQMQPHFLYNALASIREIILDDPEYASDLVYDFTTHLRACVRSMSTGALVSFPQELENVKAYINIEKMRFGERLQVEYDCQITDFDIIQLSIQPLVENAIRHGIFQRGASGGKVMVRSFREGKNIIVCVEDNGIGFNYDAVLREIQDGTRDSSGLTNLTFRFKSKMNAEVTVESEIGKGTKVTVAIPVPGEEKEE